MTFFLKITPTIKSKYTCSKPNLLIANISSLQYTALFIITISLLLRLLWIGHNNLLVEEAYYWNYAQHLDFGYLDHPPMVAVLIKWTTSIFGTNEFGVRISSILCWVITAFFSFKLTNVIARGAGLYAVTLLAILPFFFLHSLVITPDMPLTACWSAALYYLYRSVVLNESKCWYTVGIFLGLGMLSKYTIVLLGPSTLLYLLMVPTARRWFLRKEPYICVLIAALLFTPVIYWNAIHEWVSFAFQSTKRLKSTYSFSLHHIIGLLILFLMPAGIWGLGLLFKQETTTIELKTKRFLQLFTLVPLIFFSVFSLSHGIKFNWIGPGLLALIPWLALLIKHLPKINKLTIQTSWLITAILLLICYSGALFVITFGTPEIIYNKLFIKFIAWDDLTQQVHDIAIKIEKNSNTSPILVPLDVYNIGSELAFYQAKFLATKEIQQSYTIIGRQIFGANSLMYQYWAPNDNLAGKTLIVISNDRNDFNNTLFKQQTITKSPMITLWSHSQGHNAEVTPYYYQVVQMK